MDPSLITGIITTSAHGVVLTTQACAANGDFLVTHSAAVVAAWAQATADLIKGWDFMTVWDRFNQEGHGHAFDVVRHCIGIDA